MPFEAVKPYVEFAGRRFRKYSPLYFISGDTSWDCPDEERYYMSALETVRAVCPEALLTLHTTPSGVIPAGFAKGLWEAFDLFDLAPADLLEAADRGFTGSMNPDGSRIVVYLPEAFDLRLPLDLGPYRCSLLDLETRRILQPEMECGETTRIGMPPFNADALFTAFR